MKTITIKHQEFEETMNKDIDRIIIASIASVIAISVIMFGVLYIIFEVVNHGN